MHTAAAPACICEYCWYSNELPVGVSAVPRHATPACSTIATSTLITISSVGQFLQHSTHTQFRWKSRGLDITASNYVSPPSSQTLPASANHKNAIIIHIILHSCLRKLLYRQGMMYILTGRGDPGLATQEGIRDRGGREGGRKASWVATTRKILGHAHSRTGSVTNSSSLLRKAGLECILQPKTVSPTLLSQKLYIH